MVTLNSVLFGCGLLIVVIAILVKAFGRYLFQDPWDGNYNPPMDLYYEAYEEDEADHRRKQNVH